MSNEQGKITPLNVTSLQAHGVTVEWNSTGQAYQGDRKLTIDGAGPEAWFGPFQPLSPIAQQTQGRAFNYPVGQNLNYIPRGDSEVSFEQLRMLAKNLPILAIVIQKRMDQIKGWQWGILPRLAGKDRRKSGNVNAMDNRINYVRSVLRKPDRSYSFHTWLGRLIEDMLVIDAACIYPRFTNGGDLYSLDIVDGSTIKILIGEDGRIPQPDEGPAYQQILHGVPASDFNLDELMYLPRNLRSHKLYGFSPVEQVLLTVNIALRREYMSLEYYNSGTIPDGFATLPREWTTDQIKSFQEYFDSMMKGNLAERRTVKFMPDTFKWTEVRQPPLKDQYDEWLTRVICAAFGVSPTGFVADVNRATSQTLQVQASNEGIEPLKSWVKEIFDDIIQRLIGFEDLEFQWQGNDEIDPLEQAQAMVALVGAGIKTIDEVRIELGLGPIAPPKDQVNPPKIEDDNPPESEVPGSSKEVGKAAEAPFQVIGPMDLNRPELHAPTVAMEKAWNGIFASQMATAENAVADILSKISKAADDEDEDEKEDKEDEDKKPDNSEDNSDELIALILLAIDFSLTGTALNDVSRPLVDVSTDSSKTMFTRTVGVALGDEAARNSVNDGIFDQINTRAVNWASGHSGDLVSNVNVVTRQAVHDAVAEGLAGGERYTQIIDRIKALGAFSDKRAELIAETEIANANSQGALQGLEKAKDIGVAVKKAWRTARGLERICDICNENENAGPIPLDKPFPSGDMAPTAHPRCRCYLTGIVERDAAKKASSSFICR